MKKLILLSLLLLVSNQGFAKLCDDGSRPIRVISDDGSYFESVCKDQKNTSKRYNTEVPIPLSLQPDYFEVFCDKVNINCSHPDDQEWYRAYYTYPWNKAMAIAYPKGRILGGISGLTFHYGAPTLNEAKANALSQCNLIKNVFSHKCYILIANHIIVNKDYIKLLNQ